MMFKKGSFEIGATVYPVAIKVRATHFLLFIIYITCAFYLLSWTCMNFKKIFNPLIHVLIYHSGVFDHHSMIPDLETPSGIAASLAWSTICYVWWAAGPSSAVSGTFHPCPERWDSMDNCGQPTREQGLSWLAESVGLSRTQEKRNGAQQKQLFFPVEPLVFSLAPR